MNVGLLLVVLAAEPSVPPPPPSSAEAPAAVWFDDPNRSQYFFAQSAMLQRQGELSLSVKELLGVFVNVGLFDFLNVEVDAQLVQTPGLRTVPNPWRKRHGTVSQKCSCKH